MSDARKSLDMPEDLYGLRGQNAKGGMASYIWLAYSVFFFIEPIARNKARYWAEQMPIYAVFLALYILYVQTSRHRLRPWILLVFYLLGVASIPYNVGGSCFFIYVAAMLPFCVESSAVIVTVMAIEVITLALENRYAPGNLFNYLITGFFAVVVGVSNLFVAQSKRSNVKLERAEAENIELAAVAERERIARDLHDVLGHTLSVIVLKAELAGRLLGRDELSPNAARAQSEIADVERTARTALAEVREAIGGYRSKGLNAEVEQARHTLVAAGVELECETRPPALPAREETVLSLAVREAVTNIVRHAGATRCTMRFATAPDGFASFEVADDGPHTIEHEGNGLRGMRERVQELGGRFRITSEGGTTLLIELPRVLRG